MEALGRLGETTFGDGSAVDGFLEVKWLVGELWGLWMWVLCLDFLRETCVVGCGADRGWLFVGSFIPKA